MNQALVRSSFVRIKQDGKILLVQERGKSAYGLWAFPGGHVNDDETIEQGAVREAFEETGYHVELGEKIFTEEMSWGEYRGYSAERERRFLLTIFDARITGGAMKSQQDEVVDLRWVEIEQIPKLPLRWPWLTELL